MKKRKELNALIGLGDSKRKKTKKGSGHRLLRTEPPDSESDSSSEEEDFSGLGGGGGFGKRSYTQCCSLCYPLFLFIILAACVMACAGLIWMQIALKEDLDSLKEKLHNMESSQKASSSELPKLSEELKNKQRKLEEMENGSRGTNRLWANLTEINRKISLLDSAVNHLKANLKSAADLISLPTTVEELQKSVATIGSTLTSVQHDVKTMQDNMEKQSREMDREKTADLTELRKVVSEANRSEEQHQAWTHEQIHVLLSTTAQLHHRVALLENGSQHGLNEAAPEGVRTENDVRPTEAATEAVKVSTPVPGPQTSRRPRFLSPQRAKRHAQTRCPQRVALPGLTSLKDVEGVFQRAGVGRDSASLTLQDLRRALGPSAPSMQTLRCLDVDRNRWITLEELKDAVEGL